MATNKGGCFKIGFKNVRADFLNADYFRRGLTCTTGLANDLIDGGQPRAIKTVFKTCYLDGV